MYELEKGYNARDVRASHGGTGEYIKRDAPLVIEGSCRGSSGGVRRQNVHTRGCYVRLQMTRNNRVIFESFEETRSNQKNWEANLEDGLL